MRAWKPRFLQGDKSFRHSGFSLVEVLLAVGLVGIGLAIILGVMSQIRGRQSEARQERLAWVYVEQLQAELSLEHTWFFAQNQLGENWSDAGRLLEGHLPLDTQGFASAKTPLVLGFGEQEKCLGVLGANQYSNGMGEGTEVVGILAFWGQRRGAGGEVMEVTARAEFPAALPASRRKAYEMNFVLSLGHRSR